MKDAFPPRPFFGAILARAMWLWVGLHAAGMMLGGALTLNAASTLWVWGFTLAGTLLATRRQGELLILANLGFSPMRTAGLVLAWCGVMDAVLQFAASVLP